MSPYQSPLSQVLIQFFCLSVLSTDSYTNCLQTGEYCVYCFCCNYSFFVNQPLPCKTYFFSSYIKPSSHPDISLDPIMVIPSVQSVSNLFQRSNQLVLNGNPYFQIQLYGFTLSVLCLCCLLMKVTVSRFWPIRWQYSRVFACTHKSTMPNFS